MMMKTASYLRQGGKMLGVSIATGVAVAAVAFAAEPAVNKLPNKLPAPANTVVAPPAPPPEVVPTVEVVRLKSDQWPSAVAVSGNVRPWQELVIGAEFGGVRLVSVQAHVGDTVKKGQVLAKLSATTFETELETANAQVAEADATYAQAVETLERGKRLVASGGVSQQDLMRYETAKQTAEARLNAAKAQVKKQQLMLSQATLVAPDDGVISSSAAAEGAIVSNGAELFRLIRKGRLEWRAEVAGEDILRVTDGMQVTIKSPLGQTFSSQVRQVSPVINPETGRGIVFVDVPDKANFKAGLRVMGSIVLGQRPVDLLPVAAVLRQSGNDRVFRVTPDNRLEVLSVKLGEKKGDFIEVTAGLDENADVVVGNLASLKATMRVRVVQNAKSEVKKPVEAAPTSTTPTGRS